MVPTTRRRLLSGAAAALAALAGCSDSSRDTSNSAPAENPENVETHPETHVLRASDEEVVSWLPREGRGETETTDADGTETPPDHPRRRALVPDEATASRLRFAEVEGVEDARQFVEATDFDDETVYFETHSVRECYELELCYVTWSATEIDTQYGSYYRDAEVACEPGREREEATAWFIRVPDDLDPDRVTSHGSGWSSNGCHRPPWLRTTEEETPDAVVAHPVTTNSTGETADADRTARSDGTTEGER